MTGTSTDFPSRIKMLDEGGGLILSMRIYANRLNWNSQTKRLKEGEQ